MVRDGRSLSEIADAKISNVGMTELQDRLAMQSEPLSAAQRKLRRLRCWLDFSMKIAKLPNCQIDEADAALIEAVGIYQPSSFVRLANEEIGVVVKRGFNTATPKVAVLINRNGMPIVEPTVRDTSLADFKVVASVPHHDVRVQINLERLLPLTVPSKADRPW